MSAVLHYFDGRGLGEGIRIALCAANIPFEEVLYTEREPFVQLLESGKLQFNQLPLLEIDGLNLVQSGAIKTYIAQKGGLISDDIKIASRTNLLQGGTLDFLVSYFQMGMGKDDENCEKIKETVLSKYLPIFNKVLQDNGTGYLVGDKITIADTGLYEVLLTTLDYFDSKVFDDFKYLKEFVDLMNSKEEMKLYLTKYRKRKNDKRNIEDAQRVLDKKF